MKEGRKLEFLVDRTMPIPIGEQIKGQIIGKIAAGDLRANDRLPSLREIARGIEVSYAALARVYQDLSEEGFVVTEPGRGTFVADLRQLEEAPRAGANRANLIRLVDGLMGQAGLLGYMPAEIIEVVKGRLVDYWAEVKVYHMALVGRTPKTTYSLAREIENLLRSQNAQVRPVLLGDLRADPRKVVGSMAPAGLVASIPSAFQEVCGLLKSLDLRVVAVAFRLSQETRRRLGETAPGLRVGVVATDSRNLEVLVEEVAPYVSTGGALPCAICSDDRAIRDLVKSVNVVVYHGGCEKCLEYFPDTIETIELQYSPEPESVLRLIPLLALTAESTDFSQ